MKSIKNIKISSNGSINFFKNSIKKKNFFIFQFNDFNNWNYYKKIKKNNNYSNHLLNYKKKYLL